MSKGVHIRTLRWAKCSRGDRFERRAMRKTKRLKKVVGPTKEARKTKMLAEIDSFKNDSDDSNDGLSEVNNDTSHAKVPDDSSYFEEDE
jgi:hypothetical protein